MMNEVKIKNWPQSVSKTLQYRLGEKPLHEYLLHNGKEYGNETAYIFYGNNITWEQLSEDTKRFTHFLQTQGVEKGKIVRNILFLIMRLKCLVRLSCR